MKYLALLKDSLLEAIDAKVLYVMGGLSVLLMLLVGSVSFRPMTLEEELQQGMGQINWVLRMQAQNQSQKPTQFKLDHFEQTNDAAHPWEGDYRFQVAMQFPSGKDAAQQK